VICKDGGGDVQERYDRQIGFSFYRFANGDIMDYLQENHLATYGRSLGGGLCPVGFDRLESVHRQFMRKYLSVRP
jgi:hypothetical protein